MKVAAWSAVVSIPQLGVQLWLKNDARMYSTERQREQSETHREGISTGYNIKREESNYYLLPLTQLCGSTFQTLVKQMVTVLVRI